MTNIERLVKTKINPLVVPEYDGYNMSTYPNTIVGYGYLLVNFLTTNISISYIVQVFPLGSLERCHAALGSYHYIPHGLLLLAYGALEMLPLSAAAKKALSSRSGRSNKDKKN